MTYSIVARDESTGELGVAVQTCTFAVGAGVPFVRPGVGVVASQAFGERAYGAWCLDALQQGADVTAALAAARDRDSGHAMRQVGVLDATGNATAFTGEMCIDFAGHQIGDGYAVQANMMSSADVWPEMAKAFEASTGPLAHRLMSTLEAGERAGGDARGSMSAALVVVNDTQITIDLRVDHHLEPLAELARLLDVAVAYKRQSDATDLLIAGDANDALHKIDEALTTLPRDENFAFLRGGALIFSGQTDAGVAALRALITSRPSWGTIIESFVAKGLMPLPPGVELTEILMP